MCRFRVSMAALMSSSACVRITSGERLRSDRRSFGGDAVGAVDFEGDALFARRAVVAGFAGFDFDARAGADPRLALDEDAVFPDCFVPAADFFLFFVDALFLAM
jgi:hypothetical protein